MWIARALSTLMPKPDLFIVLDAPVDVMHQRKAEVTFSEAERQRTAYRALPGVLVLDASGSPDEVVATVAEAVVLRMAATPLSG